MAVTDVLEVFRIASAVAGALFAFGVIWGFSRILLAKTHKAPVVVYLCLALVGAFTLLVFRALYVSIIGSFNPVMGIAFNLGVCAVSIFGLHAQLLMISPKVRAKENWNWFNAWQYPPGNLRRRFRDTVGRILRLWRGAPTDIERRYRNDPQNGHRRRITDDPED